MKKNIFKRGAIITLASAMILTSQVNVSAASLATETVEVNTYDAAGSGVTLPDGTVLAEGKYTVPVSLRNMSNLNNNSMAAAALTDNAVVEVSGGNAKITLTFQTIYVMTCYGNLEKLYYFDSYEDCISANAASLALDTTILSYRNDGKYSTFGGANLEENLEKPKDIQFNLPYTDTSYVYVSMEVDVMAALGMTSTAAAVYIDYSNAVEIVEKTTLSDTIASASAYTADNYTADSFAALTSAISAATAVKNSESATQSQVDEQITLLNNAINALTYKAADYTAVDSALASVPSDLSSYSADSVAALNSAISAVNRSLDITKQAQVDTMAANIVSAVNNLSTASSTVVLDKDNLADGIYNVSVYLWNASANQASMAASSLLENAKIEVTDGVYKMYIYTTEMTFGSITASLQELKVYNADGSYTSATVETTDASGNPTSFSFILPSTDEYITIAVNPHVALMGNTDIAARLKIDYSTLTQAESGSTLTPSISDNATDVVTATQSVTTQTYASTATQTAVNNPATGDVAPVAELFGAMLLAAGVIVNRKKK